MDLPVIGTLWVGDQVSWLEQLCLQSFLEAGHDVVVYSYGPVTGLPAGVRTENASDILPTDKIIRHAKSGSPAFHADIFRLHMIRETGMIWADTDAYCCKPWTAQPNGHFHGWISDDKPQVNNGVLGLPKASKTLKKMLEFTSDEYPIPPWYSEDKQAKLQQLKDQGEGVHVSLLPWGVWGPNALTHFLRETGEITHSFPGPVLYPLKFVNASMPFNPARHDKIGALILDETLSVHFWGRRFRNIAKKFDGIPEKGSYISNLLESHGIDPEPTAYLMAEDDKELKTLPNLPFSIDFSMFDDADVANMILQRSEVTATGQEIRDWIDGDESGLLELARSNRDRILTEVFDIARRECALFVEAVDDLKNSRVADIGCGYAFADLELFRRYGCDLILIDIESSPERHFGFASAGAGYADLKKARLFLEKNGVPADKITTINPKENDVNEIGMVDIAVSLASCGFHYPVATYTDFFSEQVSLGGGVVLDIRKGSGGIGALKSIGDVEVLAKHPKYSTVLVRKGVSKSTHQNDPSGRHQDAL